MRRAALAVLCLFALWPAAAQDKKDAAKRLQAVNQKLAADKAALEREKAQLQRDKDQLGKERDASREDADRQKAAAARGARDVRKLRDELDAQAAKLSQAQAGLEAANAALAQTRAELASARAEGKQLGSRVNNQADSVRFWQSRNEGCEAKNAKLAGIGREMIERYRGKTCAGIMSEDEPFLGFKGVEVENMLEEYRDRIDAERYRVRDVLKEEKAK